MALLGLSVTMAVQAVGTLLLFALVVTPAATAILLTARPGAAMAVATGLAVVSVWAGLAVSAMFNVPPSFVITTIVSTIWLVVWLIAQRGAKDRSAPAPSHGAPVVEG
jgi:zinc/manganese transport system permease protein